MRKILETVSYLSLVLLVAAPVLFFFGKLSMEKNKLLMLTATVVWFATSICWMGVRKKEV